MSFTLQVPHEFRYVGAAIMSTAFVLVGQSLMVGRYRRRAGVKYPQMYAEKAEAEASKDAHLFNCAQRVHQNTLENIPIVWASTLVFGLKMPVLAASLCGLWSLSRVSYSIGYLSGDPKKRVTALYRAGSLGNLCLFLAATAQSACWVWEGVSAYIGKQ